MRLAAAMHLAVSALAVLTLSAMAPRFARALVIPAPRAGARLIEMGWDEPDTHFMRLHVASMERTPFDGCIFNVTYTRPDRTHGSFTWELWGGHAFTMPELQHAVDDLKATPFQRFHDNFLRINVTPGNVDWGDDTAYATIANNARLAARIARLGGCRGVMLDVEQYGTKLFTYDVAIARTPRSWDAVAALARTRGRAIMTAMQDEFPGITLFLTWGSSRVLYPSFGGGGALAKSPDGLLVPFLDGMIDVARDSTRIVDGHEMSYSYRDPALFRAAADSVHLGVRRIVADPARYARHVELGFGVWLDNESHRHPWDARQTDRNYFTPAGFDTALRAALGYTDRYVWIYSETPRWWTAGDTTVALPADYVRVVEHLHATLNR